MKWQTPLIHCRIERRRKAPDLYILNLIDNVSLSVHISNTSTFCIESHRHLKTAWFFAGLENSKVWNNGRKCIKFAE
jgi:hypothetical protein